MSKNLEPRGWQKKAIRLYDTQIYDMSFDHISVEVGFDTNNKPKFYDIQELGYGTCPVCDKQAPIVNLDVSQPKKLIKICDCGYEAAVNKPDLLRAFALNQ